MRLLTVAVCILASWAAARWTLAATPGLIDRPSPPLAHDKVRLRVERAGICGSDIATWKGDWPSPHVPSVKGHEVCGSVVEVGSGEDRLTAGQLVAVRPIRGCGTCKHCQRGNYSRCAQFMMYGQQQPGGWAEEMVVRYDHARPLAPSVTPDQGLFAEPIAVIAHAFNLAGSLQGASVAILGAGVLGLIAIQVAKARGASRVFATGRQDKKLELARRFGAATADARTDDVVKAGRWSHNRDPFLLESSVPGVFACGDVRLSPVKRVASAVGEGSMAIAFVHKYLQHDVQ